MISYFETHFPVSDELGRDLHRLSQPCAFPKQGSVFEAGQRIDLMWLVTQGLVRVYELRDGSDQTYYFGAEWSWLTDFSSYLTGETTAFSCDCLEPTQAVLFPKKAIEWLAERYPEIRLFYQRMAEQAYLQLDERMKRFQFDDLESRYRTFSSRYPNLLQRIPQHLVATYLGVTPESLSRVRQQLRRKGL